MNNLVHYIVPLSISFILAVVVVVVDRSLLVVCLVPLRVLFAVYAISSAPPYVIRGSRSLERGGAYRVLLDSQAFLMLLERRDHLAYQQLTVR